MVDCITEIEVNLEILLVLSPQLVQLSYYSWVVFSLKESNCLYTGFFFFCKSGEMKRLVVVV